MRERGKTHQNGILKMSNELAMCLTNEPRVAYAYVTSDGRVNGGSADSALKIGNRIHGQWLHGLFYFPMSRSNNQVFVCIGTRADFGPIIE